MSPSHALAAARTLAKRWTGARAGRAIEPRNYWFRGADTVLMVGRRHRGRRYARAVSEPRAVEEPVHARNLHAREPGDPDLARSLDRRAGRSVKAKAARLRCTRAGSRTAP